MAYSIQYKSSVKKDLKFIPKQELENLINKIETQLSRNPLANPLLKGEFKELRRFRSGNYRVIYTIEQNSIIILKIGHRKDVYR